VLLLYFILHLVSYFIMAFTKQLTHRKLLESPNANINLEEILRDCVSKLNTSFSVSFGEKEISRPNKIPKTNKIRESSVGTALTTSNHVSTSLLDSWASLTSNRNNDGDITLHNKNALRIEDKSLIVLHNISSLLEIAINEKLSKYTAILAKRRMAKGSMRKNKGPSEILKECGGRKRYRAFEYEAQQDMCNKRTPTSQSGTVAVVNSARSSFEIKRDSVPIVNRFGKGYTLDSAWFDIKTRVDEEINFIGVEMPLTYKCAMDTVAHISGQKHLEIEIETAGKINAILMIQSTHVTVVDCTVSVDTKSVRESINDQAQEALKKTVKMICSEQNQYQDDALSIVSPDPVSVYNSKPMMEYIESRHSIVSL